MTSYPFDAATLTTYLSLPSSYSPSPSTSPLSFLQLHLSKLPPHLLIQFSNKLTARERTKIPLVKNRRAAYAMTLPDELGWASGSVDLEPLLWSELLRGAASSSRSGLQQPPQARPGVAEGVLEREWADAQFMGYGIGKTGEKKGHVGKLGELLAEYEEEREAERLRDVRRVRAALARETEEEVESDSDEEEEEEEDDDGPPQELETMEDVRRTFERILRERFIDGSVLEADDIYDSVDYDDKWDPDTRYQDEEDRYFDDEDESEVICPECEESPGHTLDF